MRVVCSLQRLTLQSAGQQLLALYLTLFIPIGTHTTRDGLLIFTSDQLGESEMGFISDGQHMRRHLTLLKLAGNMPKDCSEYECLNADVFCEFVDDIKGADGVERRNLKSFRSGKTEDNKDLVNLDSKSWVLVEAQADDGVVNGFREEL